MACRRSRALSESAAPDRRRPSMVLSTRPTSAVSGQEKTGQIQNTEAYCFLVCASGVSKGSLYHHFEDLTDVIEAAMIVRFAVGVNESVKSLADIVSSAKSQEELMQGLEAVARSAHVQERTRLRATRIQMISLATMNPRFSVKLAHEQERLTDALADIFQMGQNKGLMNREFDARAAAVLIQAFTLGKIVDEIVEQPTNPEAWNNIISRLIRLVFG